LAALRAPSSRRRRPRERLLVHGSGPAGEIELGLKIDPKELLAKLAARNLPASVFGADKPLLELTARKDAQGLAKTSKPIDHSARKDAIGKASEADGFLG
jgi:hypothetical protein